MGYFDRGAARTCTEKTGQEYRRSGELDELADLLEVIYALARVKGAEPEELERIRREKAEERGGFAQRLFLVQSD